ncbi:putative membrane protein [Pullulanibacillus pueri]|uniref:Uncharacterized protein n=1 Tax=Pullulanibacillus pueri TaxID=1437324 RepID=A0A8J3EMZ0_9BACL|nr:hypothetical protein [Pullulanibacillus pueri]MBM7682638.1 putative membrane protein [Pullulanibacillus pueri]GGH82608.1 hypothetical protein GCM10007096_22250 [Pullulanibacillus pueri]
MRTGNDRMSFMERIVTGARLFFVLSVFLLLLEVITWFGATAQASKVLDAFAMLITLILLLATTLGVRLLIKWQSKQERHD